MQDSELTTWGWNLRTAFNDNRPTAWAPSRSHLPNQELRREFPKIWGPIQSPNSRAVLTKTPCKQDPQFRETAIWNLKRIPSTRHLSVKDLFSGPDYRPQVPDPWADPKSRSPLGFCNLRHRSTLVQNWVIYLLGPPKGLGTDN